MYHSARLHFFPWKILEISIIVQRTEYKNSHCFKVLYDRCVMLHSQERWLCDHKEVSESVTKCLLKCYKYANLFWCSLCFDIIHSKVILYLNPLVFKLQSILGQ